MELHQAATEVLAPLGYEVLELKVVTRGRTSLLLRIDRLDEKVVSVDDVRRASEAFGLELDRLDPFKGAYQLEVESPGAERPLVRVRHFERFVDLKAKVRSGGETRTLVVRGVEGDTVLFEDPVSAAPVRLAIGAIERATLAEWPSTPR